MATMNGVPFRQWLVPKSKWNIKAPYPMKAKKITLHNTDNQMPAHNEISYMRNNNMYVSYHLAVDEKEAIQGIPYNRNGYHAGDGVNGYGNRRTIGVEICRNYDRSRGTTRLNEPLASQYTKAEQNAIKVVAQLCIDEGIVANNANIKTHNDWDGKWCPSKILNEGRLQQVKNGIIKEYNRLIGAPVAEAESPQAPKEKEDGHLSLSQVVDKAIAGGYGNVPGRIAKINNKTNFTYDRVQEAINSRTSKAKPKKEEKAKATGQKVQLPASAKSWRVYRKDGPYTTAHSFTTLAPAKFGGLTYDVVGTPMQDVVQINTRDFGIVAIYVGPGTGATITGSGSSVVKPKPVVQKTNTQTVHLPKSASTWRAYRPNGPYTTGNEIHLLTPSAFSNGITYEIKGNPAPDVYLVDTQVKGRVAIYAGQGTGATISGKQAAAKPAPKTKRLHLPKSADTWRVYKPNGPYTRGNEIHLLTPSAFANGITYDILEEKGNHVYIINTGVKGRVAIYAGPETGARIL